MTPEPELDAPPAPGADPAGPPPDEAPAQAAPHAPTTPTLQVAPVVVPRWLQLVLLPLAVLALYVVAKAAGVVLLVFLVAAVIALVLNPLVRLVERVGLPHGLSVAATYVSLFVAVGGVIVLLINPVANQIQNFQHDVPHFVDQANARLADLQTYLDDHNINVEVKKQGQTALQTLQRAVLKRSGDIVSFTRDLLKQIVTGAFALVLILVISIYMLLYAGDIGRLTRRAMPPGDGTPEDDFPLRVQKAVFSYVRAQLLFSVIMGTTAGIALWIFGAVGIFPDGRTYAVFFGVFFGFMELIPYVGPVLGAIPPVLVALFADPLTAVWVALLFLALQQLEGHVVAPQVFGKSLRINPLLVIFALLFGAEAYGVIGALIALPIAAVLRETMVYLRRHLVFEPWGTQGAGAGAGALPSAPSPPPLPDGDPTDSERQPHH
jgi:predicted PurR-regulated permease PerM